MLTMIEELEDLQFVLEQIVDPKLVTDGSIIMYLIAILTSLATLYINIGLSFWNVVISSIFIVIGGCL